MKKIFLWMSVWVWAGVALGQPVHGGNGPACDCPACNEKGSDSFTLPGLEGLNTQSEEATESEPAEVGHEHGEGCAHGHETPVDVLEDACCPPDEHRHEHHADPIHDDEGHAGHDDPAACGHDHGPHEGHDHGAGEGGVELSTDMMAKVGIEVHEAGGGTISRTSVFPAEIKLNRDRTAAVSPRYASLVRQVFAEIGDAVKKGDVLASLENRDTMAVYTVSAPQDGIVISKDLAVGESAAEDRVLYEVADLSSVWADISIFPQYRHLIKKGMTVSFIAHDGCRAAGRVKYISPIVSHQTRTFTARCVLEGAEADFTPGAFVRAEILVESVDADVVVPVEAVQQIEGESVVFMPSDHGFVTAPVKTGLADGERVEIRSGLAAGEAYVATGAFALKAQMVTSGMDPHAGHGH